MSKPGLLPRTAALWLRAGALAVGLAALLLAVGVAPAQTSTAAGKGYRIAGQVVNADTGAPLANASVAILTVVNGVRQEPDQDAPKRPGPGGRGGGRPGGRRPPARTATQSTTTADDGSFAFDQVPAGKYSLEASRRGFITASYQEHGFYSTAIVTGAGLPTEGLTLKLSPGAVIAGTVSDNSGDAPDQATVTLYRVADDGLGSIRTYRATNTDDLGAYEFAHLPPGTYFVAATAHVWYASTAQQPAPDAFAGGLTPPPATNLDLVYPRAYYADATDSSSATPVPVRGGEHLRIDLHMQPVPAVHLTYNLPPRDPEFHTFSRPPAVFQSVFGDRDSAGESVTRLADHGKESLSISVAPGEYEVEVAGRTVSVNAGGDAVLDPSAGAGSVEITGKLAGAAGATLPDAVIITLVSADAHGSASQSAVAHEGSFHFDDVRPGAYEMEAQSEGQPMTIVQAAASGAQLDSHTLHVGSQPVSLAATVAPASAAVSGIARIADRPGAEEGTAASGIMIVLVPQHLGDRALYRRDQSDSDGSFTLGQVAGGSYTLVAIADGWDLDWAQPQVIAHYLPAGQPITVTSGSRAIHLPKPILVQPR